MKCVACKHGELRPGPTTVTLDRDGVVIVYREVPALVCEMCGESMLAAAIAERLETSFNAATTAGLMFELWQYAAA